MSYAFSSGLWPLDFKLSDYDNESLGKEFNMQEIKDVIFDMRVNSAPGPNGFGVSFFQTFWDSLKEDVLATFDDFHKGQLDIQRLNYGVITLVPKAKEANIIKQYRPICLLNVDYKWLTKALTSRLTPIAKKIIDPNQTGFIKGRNILEGVVILHEVLHELRKSKGQGLILKIDFEKAYNRVRWKFFGASYV